MKSSKIRVKLKSFDYQLIDSSVSQMVEIVKKTGASISGPVPLPTKIKKITVLKSPHVNKKSREQFEIRTHKRMIDIINTNEQTVDALMGIKLPAGVSVNIKS